MKKQFLESNLFCNLISTTFLIVHRVSLITVDIKAKGCGFQKMYTFLHLTFQEFLAAYHIAHLKRDEQKDLITLHGESKHMLQVWKFYCGLAQFDESCNQFKTLIDFMTQNCDTLFTVQCSFESQQQHTCNSVIESCNSLSFKDKFLTPSDFTANSYVIAILRITLYINLCLIAVPYPESVYIHCLRRLGENCHW